VGKKDVTEKDADLSREPEMVKAYRDTWHLGIHSYLSYLRDRLVVARDLLTDSGSIFVQISEENVHRVRLLLDDVLGSENSISVISVRKSGMMMGKLLKDACYYLLWYAHQKEKLKYRQLYLEKLAGIGAGGMYSMLESPDGTIRRRMSNEERADITLVPKGWRAYRLMTLATGGFRPNTTVSYEFNGKTYHPGPERCWRTTVEGLNNLAALGRIESTARTLNYKAYLDDFPCVELTNLWTDTGTGGSEDKNYVVQTPAKVIERCVLMSTDPGDLVLDPTCGGGTTAYVAEAWGRRWITIDTSRVAIAIARQRLLTSKYDYYQLRDETASVAGGFKYKSVPHITLKSIAQNAGLDPISQSTTRFWKKG
jgi:adenine-specific DNA-methyltransferase